MKKKILALCLVVVLAATAIIGGTMAYFSDTDTATNKFTVGNVEINLVEKGAKDGEEVDWEEADKNLMPGSKTKNNVKKSVTVENVGPSDAYMWIEVWVPAALDDGDDNSPVAPGKGNSLHFNYGKDVTETKSTYLGSKTVDGVAYNGYVHFVKNDTAKKAGDSTIALLDQVYMDSKVTGCSDAGHDNCLILADGVTHYTGSWELIINAVGFQAEGFDSIETAINQYYGKSLDGHLW